MKKNILITILAIILIVIVIFIYKGSKQTDYFNQIQLNTTNTIINDSVVPKYTDTVISVGLSSLELNNLFIQIKPIIPATVDKFNTDNQGLALQAYVVQAGEDVYIIYMSQLSKLETIKVLSHELIHIKQYVDKKIVIKDEKNILWENKTFVNLDDVSYNDRPWEIEAFNNQTDLNYKLNQILYKK